MPGRLFTRSVPAQWSPQQVPTWPVEIIEDHPLAAGLTGLFIPGSVQGNQNLVRLSGIVTSNSGPPIIGSPYGPTISFNGSGQYLNAGNAAALNPASLSIVALVMPTNLGSQQWVVARDDNTLGRSYAFGFEGLQERVQINGSAFPQFGSFANNEWVQSAFTLDSGTYSYYKNGILLGTATGAGAASTTGPTTIGRRTYSGFTGDFAGAVALAGIYQGVVPADLIAWLNAEPFAMLQPIVRRTYFIPASNSFTLVPPTAPWAFSGRTPTLAALLPIAAKDWTWTPQTPAVSAVAKPSVKAWAWNTKAPVASSAFTAAQKAVAWVGNAPIVSLVLMAPRAVWRWVGNSIGATGTSGGGLVRGVVRGLVHGVIRRRS